MEAAQVHAQDMQEAAEQQAREKEALAERVGKSAPPPSRFESRTFLCIFLPGIRKIEHTHHLLRARMTWEMTRIFGLGGRGMQNPCKILGHSGKFVVIFLGRKFYFSTKATFSINFPKNSSKWQF